MSSPTKLPASAATERILSLTNHLKGSLNPIDNFQKAAKMSTDYKFQGWMGLDKDAAKGKMVWQEYEPKGWTEKDIDIKVTHCGICGSDIHTLRSGWGPTPYPCCVGHEVVGIAVKVGNDVKHVKVGERCGLGAQASSCHRPDCEECSTGQENLCSRAVNAYASKYPEEQGGGKSYGGYSDYVRAPGHFIFKIPDGLSSAEAAPMLCGGVTTWSPLVQNGAGPGVRVGIVGVGGLGHFGLLWAKALGCEEVVAISRTSAKKADAEKMGVTNFIATDEDKDWARKNSRTLDLIVCTVSSSKMPMAKYLHLLRTNGQFIQVGAPEEAIPGFNMFALIQKGAKIGGSSIGSPQEIRDMLEFAAKNKVHPWIEERPMKDANKTVVDMEDGHARYRYVLVNEKNLAEIEKK